MSLKRPVPKKFRPRSRSVDNDGYESGYHMIPSSVNSSRTSLLEDNTQGAVFKYDSESDWENTPSTAGPKYPPYLIKALRLQHEKSNLMPKFYRNYHATSTSQLSTASSAPELYHLLTIPEIHQVFGFRDGTGQPLVVLGACKMHAPSSKYSHSNDNASVLSNISHINPSLF
ncbi:hypothetical protein M8J77_004953 [Diaphorina citri]|nr:hypothetical protein M8J77_004953 [Diaphorina citri]